jgi:hypothetical protein
MAAPAFSTLRRSEECCGLFISSSFFSIILSPLALGFRQRNEGDIG